MPKAMNRAKWSMLKAMNKVQWSMIKGPLPLN